MVSSSAREIDEEVNFSKAVQLQVQGQWTRWSNYTQNNFSWSTLLATPANLISFCIGATYDTLPSPSNLQRWKIITEPACFLCPKKYCTTAHILGACPVALKQGRFTFRHDSVLREIVNSLRNFISKPFSLPTKRREKFIHFVKPGEYSKPKKNKPSGILHSTNDWVLVADLNNDFVFPPNISSTSARPDIVIFSKSKKHVILIELTCPCEENIEFWHTDKSTKYLPLKEEIVSKDWSVDIFAIEVGARGFSSKSVAYTLKRLGYSPKAANKASKDFAAISMRCSFCIWVARNNKDWNEAVECPTPQKVTNKPNSAPKNITPTPESINNNKANKTPPKLDKPTGFKNVGNTCYANSILQALFALPLKWDIPSDANLHSPMLRSFTTIRSLVQKTNSPLDVSGFLWSIKRSFLSKDVVFDFNLQHDVPEVLQMFLNDLLSFAPTFFNTFTSTISTQIVCSVCNNSSTKEENHTIIPLSVENSISQSLKKLLMPEALSGSNQWFCSRCQLKQDANRITFFSLLPEIIVIQLNRMQLAHNITQIRSPTEVVCFPELLKVPLHSEDITLYQKYSLVATINHSGSINSGHYWSIVKDKFSDSWLRCNDSSVCTVSASSLKTKYSYVFFYART